MNLKRWNIFAHNTANLTTNFLLWEMDLNMILHVVFSCHNFTTGVAGKANNTPTIIFHFSHVAIQTAYACKS